VKTGCCSESFVDSMGLCGARGFAGSQKIGELEQVLATSLKKSSF
jgi:hypothetical protein